VTGVIGGSIVASGAVAGLLIADMPLALVAAALFGLMGMLGIWTRLRRWRPGPGRFRLPLTGRSVRLSVLAAASAALSVLTALRGMLGATAVFGAGAVLTALWSGLPAHAVPGREECTEWTTGELEALDDEASLEQLLNATEARPEGKFR
jgi:hypothetical protein